MTQNPNEGPRLCGFCCKTPITDDELECADCVADQADQAERLAKEERERGLWECREMEEDR